ncbi:LOW QUALITY PROTEIN: hypothetical protein ACHAXN_012772 [Cyclotella atomus]
MTFSGRHIEPFESLRVVPEEVLKGVRNEAPPGKFFSAKSTFVGGPQHPMDRLGCNTHSPRIQVACISATSRLFYFNTCVECPRMSQQKNGALAFWCPVLKRFISDGERFRQQHWFHNGDGSAQQRHFYNQMEMLDRNEGLANLPTTIDNTSSEVSFVGVMNFDEILANR